MERNFYNHCITHRIFSLIMNKIFIRTPKIMRRVATCTIKICSSSCILHIVQEVGEERERECLTPTPLVEKHGKGKLGKPEYKRVGGINGLACQGRGCALCGVLGLTCTFF